MSTGLYFTLQLPDSIEPYFWIDEKPNHIRGHSTEVIRICGNFKRWKDSLGEIDWTLFYLSDATLTLSVTTDQNQKRRAPIQSSILSLSVFSPGHTLPLRLSSDSDQTYTFDLIFQNHSHAHSWVVAPPHMKNKESVPEDRQNNCPGIKMLPLGKMYLIYIIIK